MRKPKSKGVSVHYVQLGDDATEMQYLMGVYYCARCAHEYQGTEMPFELMLDPEQELDDDGQPLVVCRNRLACDGFLIEEAAEQLDQLRYELATGRAFTESDYDRLTDAWQSLQTVYGEGLFEHDDTPRCATCLVPLDDREAPEGALCRFCQAKAAAKAAGKVTDDEHDDE